MIARRPAWALAAVAALALAVLPGAVDATDDEELRKPALDVQVALRDGGRCGGFGPDLPVLFSESGVQPGDETSSVEVCVRNGGRQAGRLSLAVAERVETEAACSGDEAAVDPTCQADAAGELGGSLVVDAARLTRCRGDWLGLGELGFAALATTPAPLLAQLRPRETECLSLRVRYEPASEEAATAAQTDRVTWRFAFDLSN